MYPNDFRQTMRHFSVCGPQLTLVNYESMRVNV